MLDSESALDFEVFRDLFFDAENGSYGSGVSAKSLLDVEKDVLIFVVESLSFLIGVYQLCVGISSHTE